MKTKITILAVATMGFSLSATAVNITIPDTVVSGTGWYGPQEDNETEPGTVTGQVWDMEAFLYNPATRELQMQGGFNMVQGYGTYYSGDIFIDVNGDAKWGIKAPSDTSGNGYATRSNDDYLWDYAIVFGRESAQEGGDKLTGSYSVYQLTGSTLFEVYYSQNWESNPFRYASGGVKVEGADGNITQLDDVNPAQALGYGGNDTHYLLSGIDLSFLLGQVTASEATLHFTVGCGNDLLMGSTSVPDGGMTVMLLGLSLGGMSLIARRRH